MNNFKNLSVIQILNKILLFDRMMSFTQNKYEFLFTSLNITE